MTTLASLCTAMDVDLVTCSERELKTIWGRIEKIRQKDALKKAGSPLPGGVS